MTDKQRSPEDLNRELIELLNELRVVLPGVQVLFAFLLAVPFCERLDARHRAAARRLLRGVSSPRQPPRSC